MDEPQEHGKRLLYWTLAASILAHLALLPVLMRERTPDPLAGLDEQRPIRVYTVPRGQGQSPFDAPSASAAKDRPKPRTAPDTPKPTPEEKREEAAADKLDRQVVELPPTADTRPPKDARYLSEHNTNVEKETKSRDQRQHYKNATNKLQTALRGNEAGGAQNGAMVGVPGEPVEPQEPTPANPAKSAGRHLEVPDIEQRDRLALKLDEEFGHFRNSVASEGVRGNSDRLQLDLGGSESGEESEATPGTERRLPTLAALTPDAGTLSRIAGAPANDFLEGVEEGDGTFLNSREFKYASFFNRMKRRVNEHWNPLPEYWRRDPTGNVYGQKSRVTVLSVTLERDGSLKTLEVLRTSGLEFLDHEALAAFQRASPFPNPPPGMADGGGVIEFPFGFHVEFNDTPSFRLLRYR